MIIISWNCRGLGQPRAVRALSELVKVHRPDVIFLSETLVQKQKMEEIRIKLKFDGCFVVDPIGRSGGLCVLWKEGSRIDVLNFSTNCINMKVKDDKEDEFRLTGYYGQPDRSRRAETWELLKSLAGEEAWCVMGDFNDILHASEKKGTHPHPQYLLDGFREVVTECGLTDIPLEGYPFTWWRSRGQPNAVEERLDRAMINEDWRHKFPNASLTNLTATVSDHSPILLRTQGDLMQSGSRRFRFENAWLSHTEIRQVIVNSWVGTGIEDKVSNCVSALASWGRNLKAHFSKEIAKERSRMEVLRHFDDPTSVRRMEESKEAINNLLGEEEVYWRQRAKQFWYKDGDFNTKFFHQSANGRRKHKALSRLQWEHGAWEEDDAGMGRIAVDYFNTLFKANGGDLEPVVEAVQPRVTAAHNATLNAPFSDEEFRLACFSMHPDKAPGPDGLNPAFYQKFWDVVGQDVILDCRRWLSSNHIPEEVRSTDIILLPKKDDATLMRDFRPISLCNVRYRILAKVLANRMRLIMADIIPEEQSAFVQGRSIVDNVLIAFETLHTLNLRRRAKDGEVALKVDISKAYDRVEWTYLEAVMVKMGFEKRWIEFMLLSIRSVAYSVVINSSRSEQFTPERGLRQGCPLSPFLFLICAEGLSAMVRKAAEDNLIHGVRVRRGAPAVTHLLFADDSFFFFRADIEETRKVKDIFQKYGRASGQLINFAKSGIFFSKSTCNMLKDAVKEILGVSQPFDRGKYLGMPSFVGRRKKDALGYVKDRVWERTQSWKGRLLSCGGKEVLVKSVLQAIPTYCMNVFMLPVTLTAELERMMNSFWWGTNANGGGGIAWMRWERLSVKKRNGGLGFKDLHAFNLAMVGKQGWKLMMDQDSLVTKIFKAKYFPKVDFLSATLRSNPSFAWHSILKTQSLIRNGVRWRIGDGKNIRVWYDPWLKEEGRRHVISPIVQGLEDIRVADLWIPGTKSWDVELLEELFLPDDVTAILKLIPQADEEADMKIWNASTDGNYSVKSAYKVIMEQMLQRDTLNQQGAWTELWGIHLPPKTLHFIWRVGRHVLPLRTTLRRRRIEVPITCGLCGGAEETAQHLFTNCVVAEDCWRHADLWTEIQELQNTHTTFDELLHEVIRTWNEAKRERWITILWSLWYERNQRVWTGKARPADLVVDEGLNVILEWKAARRKTPTQGGNEAQSVESCPLWHPPRDTELKCNVDAGFKSREQKWGWGAVLRNSRGELVAFRTGWGFGQPEIKEGEARGLYEALSWATTRRVSRCTFEVDSQQVTVALSRSVSDRTEFGSIIDSCRRILHANSGFKVTFVRRNRNVVAHELAQRSFSLTSPFEGHVTPSWLENALASSCSIQNH
ncbi:LINE-1 reverse transcriptase homolog [Linum perenne]